MERWFSFKGYPLLFIYSKLGWQSLLLGFIFADLYGYVKAIGIGKVTPESMGQTEYFLLIFQLNAVIILFVAIKFPFVVYFLCNCSVGNWARSFTFSVDEVSPVTNPFSWDGVETIAIVIYPLNVVVVFVLCICCPVQFSLLIITYLLSLQSLWVIIFEEVISLVCHWSYLLHSVRINFTFIFLIDMALEKEIIRYKCRLDLQILVCCGHHCLPLSLSSLYCLHHCGCDLSFMIYLLRYFDWHHLWSRSIERHCHLELFCYWQYCPQTWCPHPRHLSSFLSICDSCPHSCYLHLHHHWWYNLSICLVLPFGVCVWFPSHHDHMLQRPNQSVCCWQVVELWNWNYLFDHLHSFTLLAWVVKVAYYHSISCLNSS